MKLSVRASVPGVEKGAFQKAVQATKIGCPVSKALSGLKLDVEAELV
jgi:osmotically inducible protein OsmC